MARILAFVPDLLFGSTVLSMLQGRGHEVSPVSSLAGADTSVDLLVLDLTADAPARLAALETSGLQGVKTLAFYSHVEADVRERALEAGIDAVVPRSRMAREGAALADRLLAG